MTERRPHPDQELPKPKPPGPRPDQELPKPPGPDQELPVQPTLPFPVDPDPSTKPVPVEP